MMQDKFSEIAHGDVRISKAPPITFIDEFLTKCTPIECKNKCVFMDQGGGLFRCPGMLKTFKKHGCQVCMSGSEASHQNPVERYHQTIANAVQAMLPGANLPTKFWPFAFMHSMQIFNSLPSANQAMSPAQITAGKKEN